MRRILRALAVMALVFACGDGDSPSGPGQGGEDSAYYPLSVGNQWVYDRSGTMEVAGIQTGTLNGENICDITGEVTHELGFDVYVQEYSIADTLESAGQTLVIDSTYTTYMRLTDQGLYSYVSLAGGDSVSFVPFPLQVGATWQFSENPPMTAEIVSLTETVTVPAGTFENCLELRVWWIESGSTLENVSSFAPDVGRVKNVYTYSYQNLVTTIESELLSYSVN